MLHLEFAGIRRIAEIRPLGLAMGRVDTSSGSNGGKEKLAWME